MTPSGTQPDPCVHCGLPIPEGERVEAEIAGACRAFCCHGCAGAYRIITGAGLGDFYRNRRWETPGVPDGAFETRYTDAYLADFTVPGADGDELAILVEGIRCASCVWLLERVLGSRDGVLTARVNFATHKFLVRYRPERVGPAELFAAVAALGYLPRPYSSGAAEQLAQQERRGLLFRFATAAFLSMQLMGYSLALYAGYFQGMPEATRDLLQWLAAAVATPVVFYAGSPFLGGAWRSLRHGRLNMDTLIALGVLAAYGYSLLALWRGGEVYFDTAAMIVTLLLTGRLFEAAARRRACAGIDRLLRLVPDLAHRVAGDATLDVPSATLTPGETILVRPGERFPTDGRIESGATEVDEAAVSGEPAAVLRGAGDPVASGTLNLLTAVTVTVTAPPSESFIGRVARLVEQAQARRAPIQRLADRVAGAFVPVVVLVAAASGLYWGLVAAQPATGLLAAVAVLVVACPCALGLATPTAVLVASGAATRGGVLFRGGDTLEALAAVQLVAFDKTGTLTEGRPSVRSVHGAQCAATEVLRLAAAAEAGSTHPLARAVVAAARQRHLPVAAGHGAVTHPGRGVECATADGLLRVGSRRFLAESGIAVPDGDRPRHVTEVHVACGSRYCGRIDLEDGLRGDAAVVVDALKRWGLETVLLTGDRPEVAVELATRLGIEQVLCEQTPADKAAVVQRSQSQGRPVLMVGDGINDAPALSAAAVGCAVAGGTDIALETSDLVLTRPDLERIPFALALARRTLRIVRQNLFWAFTYNLVAIPLAASGRLAPVWAAAAMAASSVCVLANSLRLGKAGARTGENTSSRLRTGNCERQAA